MKFEIGKITVFDGYYGKIVSENGEYIFLNEDIESEKNIDVGALVIFRGEKINNQKRAYFIKPAEEILVEKKNKEKVYHE